MEEGDNLPMKSHTNSFTFSFQVILHPSDSIFSVKCNEMAVLLSEPR